MYNQESKGRMVFSQVKQAFLRKTVRNGLEEAPIYK